MKYEMKLAINTVETDDESVEIFIKIKTADILKAVMKGMGKQIADEYKNVSLNIISDQVTFGSEVNSQIIRVSDEEYLTALTDGDISMNGYGAAYNLVTLQSNVIKFYRYIYNHLYILSSKSYKKGLTKITKSDSDKGVLKKEKITSQIIDDGDEGALLGKITLSESDMKRVTSKHNNVAVKDWNSDQFLSYIKTKFIQYYSYDMFSLRETDSDEQKELKSRGEGFAKIGIKRMLIDTFAQRGKTNADLKEYLDWLFDEKCDQVKFPIGMGFILSSKVIGEWIWIKGKGNKSKAGRIGQPKEVKNKTTKISGVRK